MKFSSENYSGDVNIQSGPGGILIHFPPESIHISPESLFTSLRNDYSHATKYTAASETDGTGAAETGHLTVS